MRINLSIVITFLGLIINYLITSITDPFNLHILGTILFFVIFFSTWAMGFIPACVYLNRNDIYNAGEYWVFENGRVETIKTNLSKSARIGKLIIPVLIFAPVIFIFMRDGSILLLVMLIIILGGLSFGKALSQFSRF